MAFVTSIPNKITTDEVEFGASISEEQATKVAGSINWILDYNQSMQFGIIGGTLSGLTLPYNLISNSEISKYNYDISGLDITIGETGDSSNSSFKLKRKRSGVWSDLYTIQVNHSLGSNLVFKNTETISGITQNLILSSLNANDILMLEILSVNSNFRNITITLNLRPTE